MHRRRCPRLLLVVLACGGALLFAPSAMAQVVLNWSVGTPVVVTVGDTGAYYALSFQNQSTGAEATQSVTLDSIDFVPACGTMNIATGGDCPSGFADPDVFSVTSATGGAGTVCAGETFTVLPADSASGQVIFAPSSTIVLPPDTRQMSSWCEVDFKLNVLHGLTHPLVDGSPNHDDTAQLVFVAGIATDRQSGTTSGEFTTVVQQAVPGLSGSAPAQAALGSAVTDAATLSAASPAGPAPTGTMTFTAFGPDDPNCSGPPAFTSTSAVAGTGTYESGLFTLPSVLGTYEWSTSYSGDVSDVAVKGPCGGAGQTTTVPKSAPSLSAAASAATLLGSTISDAAVLSGSYGATGTITFAMFGPGDPTCTGVPAFTSTVPVHGDGSYGSGDITPPATGVYRFQTSYDGDADNDPVAAGACGDPSGTVTVSAATPFLFTQASPATTAGATIADSATLVGVDPTGSITFDAYGPDDPSCAGTPASTSAAVVSGNGIYHSASVNVTAAGTYHFQASYSGDAQNTAVALGGCVDPDEAVVVAPPSSTTSTTTGGSASTATNGAATGTTTTTTTATMTATATTTTTTTTATVAAAGGSGAPGSTTGGGTAQPSARFSIATVSLGVGGRVAVQVNLPVAGQLTGVATLLAPKRSAGSAPARLAYGRASRSVRAGVTVTLTIRRAARARKLPTGAGSHARLRVTVSFHARGGSVSSQTVTLAL